MELYSKQASHSIEQLFYLKEEQLLRFNTVKKVTSATLNMTTRSLL